MSEFRRQHPVAAVTQLLAVLRQNFITFLLVIFFGSRNTGEYFWYFFLFGIVMAAVLGVFSWFRFYYRVIGSELQIKKGIFIRKNIYLSKDRIQVINITEGFIQRLFGLVSVEVKAPQVVVFPCSHGQRLVVIASVCNRQGYALLVV